MIPLLRVFMAEGITDALKPVFDSGYIGQGAKVEEFEKALRERFNSDYVITTNTGTSAEHLALRLIDLQPGDEVLTSPLTCTATNWPLVLAGAKLKWVDVNDYTLSIDLIDLSRKLTINTKAIVFVNWGGVTPDLTELDSVLDKHEALYGTRPWVVEDCAHAFGTEWEGKPLASREDGHLRFFSFQAIKHLTCGDGGCLVVPTQEMYRRGKLLRWYGIDRENNSKDFRCEADVPEAGDKLHMNDINATIGLHNLKEVDWVLKRHRENADFYIAAFRDCQEIQMIKPPYECRPSWWLFTILVDNKDSFMAEMKNKGIVVSRVHERNDKHSCVKEFRVQLPYLDYTCDHMVCIPVGWWLAEEERNYIADSVLEAVS